GSRLRCRCIRCHSVEWTGSWVAPVLGEAGGPVGRRGCVGREQDAGDRWPPAKGERCHPWAVAGVWPPYSLPLPQQFHLTVVVAVVRTFRRTSAHKGSPVFRRR